LIILPGLPPSVDWKYGLARLVFSIFLSHNIYFYPVIIGGLGVKLFDAICTDGYFLGEV